MSFKFNPITGTLDLVGGQEDPEDHHASWYHIEEEQTVLIVSKKQSVVHGELVFLGTLEIDGQLILED